VTTVADTPTPTASEGLDDDLHTKAHQYAVEYTQRRREIYGNALADRCEEVAYNAAKFGFLRGYLRALKEHRS
jgi:hypothetical protein